MSNTTPGQYEIWLVDLNPAIGDEPGKIRPAVILQTDILNKYGHTTFIVCPVSSQQREGISLIRIDIKPTNENGLLKESYVLCDQLRAIDISKLKKKIGLLDKYTISKINDSIKAILSL